MKITDQMSSEMPRYTTQYFVDFDALVRRTGVSQETVDGLIDAGAAPGTIYAQSEGGDWWSALGAYVGREETLPPDGAEHWYNPGSVWWLRRALLGMKRGQSASAAAAHNKAYFIDGFLPALENTEHASLAYPSCFDGARLVVAKARETGDAEWAAWVQGAYGVCMRRFSAQGCVEKEALRARIVAALETEGQPLEDNVLFNMSERLEALVLPFAPWERPGGTPGKAIDAPLTRLGLGFEEPY